MNLTQLIKEQQELKKQKNEEKRIQKERRNINKIIVSPFDGTVDCHNMILAKDVFISTDMLKMRRNCNTLIISGSEDDSDKEVFESYTIQNLKQANMTYIIEDPKGLLYERTSKNLEDAGYDVYALNLSDITSVYNPFDFFETEDDIHDFCEHLYKNSMLTPTTDVFFEYTTISLLEAVMLYVFTYEEKSNQTMSKVIDLLNNSMPDINDTSDKSSLDLLFEKVEKEDPKSEILKLYARAKVNEKTYKSIVISLLVLLSPFNMKSNKENAVDLKGLYNKKQALYIIIDSTDTAYYPIVKEMLSHTLKFFRKSAHNTIDRKRPHIHYFYDKMGIDILKRPSCYETATDRKLNISYTIIEPSFSFMETRDGKIIAANTDILLIYNASEIKNAYHIYHMKDNYEINSDEVFVKIHGFTGIVAKKIEQS